MVPFMVLNIGQHKDQWPRFEKQTSLVTPNLIYRHGCMLVTNTFVPVCIRSPKSCYSLRCSTSPLQSQHTCNDVKKI